MSSSDDYEDEGAYSDMEQVGLHRTRPSALRYIEHGAL